MQRISPKGSERQKPTQGVSKVGTKEIALGKAAEMGTTRALVYGYLGENQNKAAMLAARIFTSDLLHTLDPKWT